MSGPSTVTKTNTAGKRKAANGTLTIMLVLLIAIAIMGILVAKKYITVGQVVDPEELAIKELTEQVNSYPEDIQSRASLAYGLQSQQDFDGAREQYNEVLKVDPNNHAALYNLGEIARINENPKEAEKYYKQLLSKAPSHVLGNLRLSQLYVEQKKYDDAIKIVDSMLVYNSAKDKIEFYLVKGQAYEKKGDKTKAKEAYQKVLSFIPDNPEAKEAVARLK